MCQILANSDIIYPRGDAIQNKKTILWSFFSQFLKLMVLLLEISDNKSEVTHTAWVFFNCHFFFVRWVDSEIKLQLNLGITDDSFVSRDFLSLFFSSDEKKCDNFSFVTFFFVRRKKKWQFQKNNLSQSKTRFSLNT